jgi:serine/threonine-protein kinase
MIAFALLAPAVHAQVAPDQKAAAEALFDKGVNLMRQGEYAQACAYLEQSQAVERGIGTMLWLAQCYAKIGRTASAWALYREASSAAQAEGQAERAQQGAEAAAQLEPQLAKLAVLVPPAAQVPELEITRNGQPLATAVWGVMVPVDPGPQKIEARAPGHESWSHTESVARGGQLSVTVPPLTASAAPPPPPVAAAVPEAPAAPARAIDLSDHQSSGGKTQRTIALVTGTVGVVGLGLGSYFGIRAASKNSDAEKQCPDKLCNVPGFDLQKKAQDAATLSNIFVIGGVALLGTGIVLYFTAPKDEQPGVALRGVPGGAELSFEGRL